MLGSSISDFGATIIKHQKDNIMKKVFKQLPLLAALVFLLFTFGCGTIGNNNHAILKDRYISEQVNNYVFQTNFERVWAEARSLLFVKGYQVRDSGNGYTVETESVRTQNGSLRRYFVTGYPNQDGSSTVRFNYFEESAPTFDSAPRTKSGRDLLLETELIKSLEPNVWTKILNDAEVYATQNAKASK